MTVERVAVPLPDGPYEVVVGPGLLDDLTAHVPLPPTVGRVAVVSVAPVHALYGSTVERALRERDLDVHAVIIPDGEESKTLDTLAWVYHRFAAIPLRRTDLVVALGGGVVGDLAGYAAATWNRGVDVLQVPTTLLAQVDAAIGGKTGVNLAEGKNLVGAFHQPIAVVADTAVLATLPSRERTAGLGEAAKYGFIADVELLELLERRPAKAVGADTVTLSQVVQRSAAVKARVVAADEREAGERALLNYGHTVGHAIEALTGYTTYRHGEAVALGMVAAARLGERLGISENGLAQRTERLLEALGLPIGGVRLDPTEVWQVMERDKKARDGVRFVLCTRPGHAVVVDEPDRATVDGVLRSLA